MADVNPSSGEWLCYRGNGTQDAHSSSRGHITNPKIVWKHFVGMIDTTMLVEPGKGKRILTISSDASLNTSGEDHGSRWGFNPWQGEIEGRQQAVPATGTTTYADVLPDVPGLEKLEFESGFDKPTVNGEWQPCVGRCFAWKDGAWTKVWETESIDMLFQPLPLTGDFDGDGKLEIAILPWYDLLILDASTGKVKDKCRFTDGRSYGFLGAYDLDRDGKSEFVVLADFAKHIDVLGYRGGKLSLLWRMDIESGFDNPQKILRVNPNPVGDVDGDGMLELIVSLYNDTGDGRWHTIIHDGMTGQVKADLPDQYLNAVSDVDGDGVSELLTTRANGNGIPSYGRITVFSFKSGKIRSLWHHDGMAWQEWDRPLSPCVNSLATLAQRDALHRINNGCATVVLREKVTGKPGWVRLSAASWKGRGFNVLYSMEGPNLEALALDERGCMLARSSAAPDTTTHVDTEYASARVLRTERRGPAPLPVVVARSQDGPTIIAQGAGEELVGFKAAGGEGKPCRDLWRIPGRGQSTAWAWQSYGPVIADLSGDGDRLLIYAVASPNGYGRLVVSEPGGKEVWYHDFPDILGSAPVWNTGGILTWQVGHFRDKLRQDVLVTVRRSLMHSEETYLLSGATGDEVWHRDHEISNRGVGGTQFAIADINADGLDEVVSLHPSILYILDGKTGKDITAMDTTWDQVPVKPVYWGIPVAACLEPGSRPMIFFGTERSSMTGLIDPGGKLVWWDALDISPRCLPAFGDFDGDGKTEVIGAGYPDGVRCYDAGTGAVQWRMAVPADGAVTGSASADLNSDGHDEAIFSIGLSLCCIGSIDDGKSGKLLWKIDLPALTGPPAIADVDGNSESSILLSGSDGCVYCIR